jgi:hypothetical protein
VIVVILVVAIAAGVATFAASMWEHPRVQLPIGAFICDACNTFDHAGCRGGTWCDCQHREN